VANRLQHIRTLEGVWQSVKLAQDRKRKGLTLHADELAKVEAALDHVLKRIEGLDRAIKPFANAGHRCAHYGNPHGGVGIIAINDAGNHIWELHAVDHDLHGGEDRLLTVQDLLLAYSVAEEF
jgi:hypothetical protein